MKKLPAQPGEAKINLTDLTSDTRSKCRGVAAEFKDRGPRHYWGQSATWSASRWLCLQLCSSQHSVSLACAIGSINLLLSPLHLHGSLPLHFSLWSIKTNFFYSVCSQNWGRETNAFMAFSSGCPGLLDQMSVLQRAQ